MILKLEPRQMIRVSAVAKKLHEVIDYLNGMAHDVESGNGDIIQRSGDREANKKRII